MVDPAFEFVVAAQQIRLVPAHDALGVIARVLPVSAIVQEVVPSHTTSRYRSSRSCPGSMPVVRGVEVAVPTLHRRDQRIAAHGLPFAFREGDRCLRQLARFRRNESARAPPLVVCGQVVKAGEAIRRASPDRRASRSDSGILVFSRIGVPSSSNASRISRSYPTQRPPPKNQSLFRMIRPPRFPLKSRNV